MSIVIYSNQHASEIPDRMWNRFIYTYIAYKQYKSLIGFNSYSVFNKVSRSVNAFHTRHYNATLHTRYYNATHLYDMDIVDICVRLEIEELIILRTREPTVMEDHHRIIDIFEDLYIDIKDIYKWS